MPYNPKPVDTREICLDAALIDLTEKLAENVHDTWAQRRMVEGWRYGPVRNDASKEHPNLVPYGQLPEYEREYDRRTALETLRMLLALGYRIAAPTSKPSASTHQSIRAREELERLNGLLSTTPNLQALISIWNGRDPDAWAGSETLFRILGEAVLKIGEPLLAYDVTNQGLEHFPTSVRLRQLLGLALARSGAGEAAKSVLTQLYQEGHHDEETLGLLARTYKDLADAAIDSEMKQSNLRRAKDFYARAYELTGGYWSGVNAATLAVVLGERDYASKVARELRTLCDEELTRLRKTGGDLYWVLATQGEVALILGECAEAEQWYSQAAEVGRKRYGDLHSSRRNARLLMTHLNLHSCHIETCFHLPAVVVFSGHSVDNMKRHAQRFPADLETKVHAKIRERLCKLDAGFGYGSVACVPDILFFEAMLERGGEIQIVLPYEKAQFTETSVVRSPAWRARFEKVLERAAGVVVASGPRSDDDGILHEYANRILYGLARSRAEQLETGLEALAVSDGGQDHEPGGTANVIESWQAAGIPTEIIDIGEILQGAQSEVGLSTEPLKQVGAEGGHANQDFAPEIRAMLFADAADFSKLSETELTLFVRHYLGLVGDLVRDFSPAPLMKNTWGDGLYLVFADVRSAGRFALELLDRVKATHWSEIGLEDLKLRIGLHAGPVYACIDPVTKLRNYIGAHVSRAARIEPITPPGNIYVSQSFAALAAAETDLEFGCNYVGQTALAKQYGTFPTYVLFRRHVASGKASRSDTFG